MDENNKKVENGVFYISYEDYLKHFAWTFICKHDDSLVYNYARYKFSASAKDEKEYSLKINNFVTCFIEVTKKTRCYISLYQPPKRYCHDLPDFNIPQGMLIIASWINGTYKYVNSEYVNYERLVIEQVLEPGEYHIFAKCYWKYPNKKYKLVVSTYSEHPLQIYDLKKPEIPQNWYKSILYDMVLSNGRKKNLGDKVTMSYLLLEKGRNTTGFIIFHIDNKSVYKANVLLIFSEWKGLRVIEGKLTNNTILVEIPSKNSKAVILQCIDFPYNIGLEWDYDIYFDYSEDQVVRKFIDSEKTEKKMLDENLGFYKITYDGGVVILLDNLSGNKYTGQFTLTSLQNVIFTGKLDNNSISFEINPKSKLQYHFKAENRFKKFKLDIDNCIKIQKV